VIKPSGFLRAAAIAIIAVVTASAAGITSQSASSYIEAGGTEQARQDVASTNGFASSQAIWPAGNNIPQGRTAARSGDTEIAANAGVFSDLFTMRPIDLALSQATYIVQLPPILTPQTAALQVYLPPSYVEIVNNAELQFNEMHALFFAELRVCLTATCTIGDRQFYFQVNADGSYRNMNHSIQVSGNPSLDLSPLQNPTVTDTSGGFLRTYLVEFPDFTGVLDLGLVPGGSTLTVEYVLQARANGIAQFNSAIAAINDPFLVDTDPVLSGAPLLLTTSAATADVPEPSTALLCGPAAIALWMLARRRKNRVKSAS
jgi:hypothetical protein